MALNATFAIVAVCDPGFATFATFVPTVRSYAKRHQHTLVLHERSLDATRHTAYSKVLAMQRALELPVDWLWSIDCDSLIVDEATPLGAVLDAALESSGQPAAAPSSKSQRPQKLPNSDTRAGLRSEGVGGMQRQYVGAGGCGCRVAAEEGGRIIFFHFVLL